MKKKKLFLSLIPAMLMWLVLSVIGWGFVYARVTTYAPEEKIALYVDGQVPGQKALGLEMETVQQTGIRAVEVRPFSYAMFGADELRNADLFIIPEGNIQTYLECFAPWPEGMEEEGSFYTENDTRWGLKIFDAKTGEGAAKRFIAYDAGMYAGQDYYLFFGNLSRHVTENQGAADDAALAYARYLLNME